MPIGTRAISLPRESSTEIQPPCQVSSSDNSLAICIACASAASGLAYTASPMCSKESPSEIVKRYFHRHPPVQCLLPWAFRAVRTTVYW
jgi:hypothetical protein